jgi:hypothetical protein
VSSVEAKPTAELASAHKDAEGFARKIALREDELAHNAGSEWCLRGIVESNLRSSPFNSPGGSEMCHAIIDPPWARHHLSEGMWLMALRHNEMARDLAMERSQRLSAHPVTPSTWKLWVSWLPNSRSWRSGAHDMSILS